MEQLDSHWTDYHEICCLKIFLKPVAEFRRLLKSETKNGSFIRQTMNVYDTSSLNSAENEKNFQAKIVEEILTYFIFNKVFLRSCR